MGKEWGEEENIYGVTSNASQKALNTEVPWHDNTTAYNPWGFFSFRARIYIEKEKKIRQFYLINSDLLIITLTF